MSNIDVTKPEDGVRPSKTEFRQFRSTLKSEIEALELTTRPQIGTYVRATDWVSQADLSAGNDVSTALITMREALRDYQTDNPGVHFEIHFPPGRYHYTNNYFLKGLDSIDIRAYGAIFQNDLNSGSKGGDCGPLTFGNFLHESTPFAPSDPSSTSSAQADRLFETVAAGQRTITLTTTAEAAEFAIGDRVFIHGFDMQGTGFPPNPYYWEWHVVEDVDLDLGTLTFREYLRHSYSTEWLDLDTRVGLPRVLQLDKPSYSFPRFIAIRGARFFCPTTAFSVVYLTASAEETLLEDVELIQDGVTAEVTFNPSVNRKWTAIRCKGKEVEIDKLIDRVVIDSCEFQRINQGTGANHVIIRNHKSMAYPGTSQAGPVVLGSKFVTLENCDLYSPPDQNASFPAPIRQEFPGPIALRMKNCWFGGFTDGIRIRTGSVSPDSIGAGNEMLFDLTDEGAAMAQLRIIRPGRRLYRLSDGATGVVTSITQDGTNAVVDGTWTATLDAADVFEFSYIDRLEIENCGFFSDNMALSNQPLLVYTLASKNPAIVQGADFPLSGTRTFKLWGTPEKIEIVVRGGAGTAASTFRINFLNAAGLTASNVIVNAAVPGKRVLDADGTAGAQTGDTLVNTPIGVWTPSVAFTSNSNTFTKLDAEVRFWLV